MEFPQHQSMSIGTKSKQREFLEGPSMPDRGKLGKQMEMSSIPREIPQHPFGSFTREKSEEKWALKDPSGSTKGKSEQSDSLCKLDEMVRQPFPSLSTIQQSEKRELTKLEFLQHPSSSTRKKLEQRELPQLSSEFTNRKSEQMEFPQHQTMSTRTKSKPRDFQKGPQMPIRGKFIKRKAVKNQSESARQMLLQKVYLVPMEIPQQTFGPFKEHVQLTREKSEPKKTLEHPSGFTKRKYNNIVWGLDKRDLQQFSSLSIMQQSEKHKIPQHPSGAIRKKSEQRKSLCLEFPQHPLSSTRGNLEQRKLPQLSSTNTTGKSKPRHQSMSTRRKSKQREFFKGPLIPTRRKSELKEFPKNLSGSTIRETKQRGFPQQPSMSTRRKLTLSKAMDDQSAYTTENFIQEMSSIPKEFPQHIYRPLEELHLSRAWRRKLLVRLFRQLI